MGHQMGVNPRPGKGMLYFMAHSTHFNNGYFANMDLGTKEGNVLFNDTLSTF